MSHGSPRIAIVGGGPIGIEAALAAAERGWPFTVYEAAGSIAGNVRDWGHVRLFTPWDMNVSARVRRALGDAAPAGPELPTGAELVERAYAPAARLLGDRLKLGTRVRAIAREGLLKHEEISSAERGRRPFRLLVAGPDGEERVEHADAVVDCSGTYGNPNALGDGGIPAPGEAALGDRIERRMPDLARSARDWAGKRILLTGSGHSAQTAARELAELARDAPGTSIVWAIRGRDESFGAVAGDSLPARAELNRDAAALAGGASPAVSVSFGAVTERLASARRAGRRGAAQRGGRRGRGRSRAGPERRRRRRVDLPPAAGPRVLRDGRADEAVGRAARTERRRGGDCLAVGPLGPETLVNPEPGFFILGAKSYGRNSQFLMQTGWQQVDDAFALLAG